MVRTPAPPTHTPVPEGFIDIIGASEAEFNINKKPLTLSNRKTSGSTPSQAGPPQRAKSL
jgi:hypothetical protein